MWGGIYSPSFLSGSFDTTTCCKDLNLETGYSYMLKKKINTNKSFNRLEKHKLNGYIFAFPAALTMGALIVYPMLYSVYLSFFNTNLVNRWNFVGFKYYIDAFTKPEFYSSVLLTFKFML